MNETHKITADYFLGKWLLSRPEYLTNSGVWRPVAVLHPMDEVKIMLTFLPDYYLETVENSLFDPPHPEQWSYDPATRLLTLDESFREPDGFLDWYESHEFRVGAVSDNEVVIYSLEDVESEPDDYDLRHVLKRL